MRLPPQSACSSTSHATCPLLVSIPGAELTGLLICSLATSFQSQRLAAGLTCLQSKVRAFVACGRLEPGQLRVAQSASSMVPPLPLTLGTLKEKQAYERELRTVTVGMSLACRHLTPMYLAGMP